MQIELKQFYNGRPLVLRQNQHLTQIIRALEQTQSYAEIIVVTQQMNDGVQKYLLATNALLHLRDWNKLVQYCDRGLRYGDESQFYHLKGKAMGKLGNIAAMTHLLQKAILINPHLPAYRRNLANAYYQQKKYQDADIEQQRAIQLEPNNHINHHNHGTTLFRLAKYSQAESAFAAAIAISPKQALSHSWRGDCLRMLGRLPDALQAYNQAFELSGNPIYLRERDKVEDLLKQGR